MKKKQIFLIIILSLLPLLSVSAFQFSPINTYLSPFGADSRATFKLINQSDKPEAVNIYMASREMDIDGNEINTNADEDFILYPSQIILMPNTMRTVRLEWIGNPEPDKELAYRIIAEQLPIDLENEENSEQVQLNINIRYMGSVYIRPENVLPDIVIESIRQTETDDWGYRELLLEVYNRGTAHRILKDFRILLPDGTSLDSDKVEGMNGSNILAGSRRRFLLPWPRGLDSAQFNERIKSAEIEFNLNK